ncbi:MAG: hypothetical protein Q9209_003087 [Squamulea sp. 1 TL-2023]
MSCRKPEDVSRFTVDMTNTIVDSKPPKPLADRSALITEIANNDAVLEEDTSSQPTNNPNSDVGCQQTEIISEAVHISTNASPAIEGSNTEPRERTPKVTPTSSALIPPMSPQCFFEESKAQYTSSRYSTPTPQSRSNKTPSQTPESSRSSHTNVSPKSQASNSYLQLLHVPSQGSIISNSSSQTNDLCAPHVTAAEPPGIFERSVGNGPEGSGAFLSLAQIFAGGTESEEEEKPVPDEGPVDNEAVEQSSSNVDDQSEDSACDRTSSAWERAMASHEQSFLAEMADAREDHAAEVNELEEKIVSLEKEAKAYRQRKAYVESVARKKLAHKEVEIKQKDEEICFQTSLCDAAMSELEDKEEQLRKSQQKTDMFEQWNIHTSSLYSDLKDKYDYEQIYTVAPMQEAVSALQQEVARLTALNLDQERKLAYQSSQIHYLQDWQAQAQQGHNDLISAFSETCQERDQSKANLQMYSDLYEQTLRELITAQKDINAKDQRLKDFNYEHENHPHPRELADLLQRTKDAYHIVEVKANECLLREQQGQETHYQDKKSWKLNEERQQKKIENLEAKISLLELSNGRLANDLEQIATSHISDKAPSGPNDPLSVLYEESKKTISELQNCVSQQESQIACQDEKIHQNKVTMSLYTLMLEEKDIELQNFRQISYDAERQIEEIRTRSDERELAFGEEMGAAINDIDLLIEQNQKYISQIQKMTTSSIPATVMEIHQSEIQGMRQYIADVEAENYQFRRQQHEQSIKDWHDANAAAGSEHASKVMQLNWENAQEEIGKLKRDIAILRQECDLQIHESVEQLAEQLQELRDENEELRRSLRAAEEKLRDAKQDLCMDLYYRIEKTINDIMRKYEDDEDDNDGDCGQENEENTQAEQVDMDPTRVQIGQETRPDLENTTTVLAGGSPSFTIPPSTILDSWTFATNPAVGTTQELVGDRPVESDHTSLMRPGRTFTAPSSSSSALSSCDSAFSSSENDEDGDDNQDDSTGPVYLDESAPGTAPHIADHKIIDLLNNSNNSDLQDNDDPGLHSMIIYDPVEGVEVELITKAAYQLLLPFYVSLGLYNRPGQWPEWGHQSTYTRHAEGSLTQYSGIYDAPKEREDQEYSRAQQLQIISNDLDESNIADEDGGMQVEVGREDSQNETLEKEEGLAGDGLMCDANG